MSRGSKLNTGSPREIQMVITIQTISLNRTSVRKVMTILISRELPLFIFKRLDISRALSIHSCEKLWPFEILKSFLCSILSLSTSYAPESNIRVKSYDHLNLSRKSVVRFLASWYAMRLNRTCEWKVMTIWISRIHSLFNFERLDMLCAWIGHASEKLWPFAFLDKIRCSISSVSIRYAPESDMRVKCYDHLNFSRTSVVQFRASRYVMRLNRTCEWKVMCIWIARKHSLFNFERLDMLCAWIGHASEKLWPFEFLESFRC